MAERFDWAAVKSAGSSLLVLAAMAEYSDTAERRAEVIALVRKLNAICKGGP